MPGSHDARCHTHPGGGQSGDPLMGVDATATLHTKTRNAA
jgi:hypothetical protein